VPPFPGSPTQSGYEVVTISGLTGGVVGAEFSSDTNAFEFASISNVPLPASAPMFGAALVALGAVGFAVKRRRSAAAAA
jgi:hypothetical protein